MAERISFHDQIKRNKIKSVLLILIIFIVFIALGYVISYGFSPDYFFSIMIIAIITSIIYILVGYYQSDNIALGSVGAKPASNTEHRQLYHSVEGLCLASGMPMPKLYVMENEQINAFATGRDPKRGIICVTTGALKKLNKQELEGVLAHELSHIANYDIRFMTLTAVMVGMIAIFSQLFLRSLWFRGGSNRNNKGNAIIMLVGIALAIIAPLIVKLVQLAISRKREYAADASAVKFTRYTKGLIGAFKKIKNEHPSEQSRKNVNKVIAPLFISDPFKRKVSGLFSTHPDIGERIKILERM